MRTGFGAPIASGSAVAIGALVLGLAYVVSLLPGVRAAAGFSAILDGWLNGVFDTAVIVVLVLRGIADRPNRASWWLLAAALYAALLGSLATTCTTSSSTRSRTRRGRTSAGWRSIR